MAEVIYQDPVKEIKGALAKHGVINRRKLYRDEKGRIVHEGTPEAYRVKYPRDWDKNPPQGDELKKINRFREACRLTKEIMQAATPDSAEQAPNPDSTMHTPNPDSAITAEQRARYESYKQRYQRQLGRKADPAAPIDPKTGRPKRYFRLDNFIRSIIYQNLKSEE